jgi:fibronectin-binding autotransporter adhesin
MAYKFQSGEAILSGNLKQEGTISGSGDVTLAVGKDFNIAGSNVLNLTTLGSSVVGSSLTSVGTLVGVTSSQPVVASAGVKAAGNISGSSTLQIAGAANFNGNVVAKGKISNDNIDLSAAGVISGSGDLQLGVGSDVNIAGSNVLNLTTLGSSVLASSLTSVGTLVGVTSSQPVIASAGIRTIALSSSGVIQVAGAASFNGTVAAKGKISNDNAEMTAAGIISGSGDLQLGVGSDVNIAGSNVLNLTTLGSTVLASSLTSVGTLVGVTSSRPIVAQQGLRVSGGVISGSTGISGSSAKFSGIVNAGRFVGNGGGITGITADLVDVTASAADRAYELAFVETLGTGKDLGGNLGLSFNPKGTQFGVSSSLMVSGTHSGFQNSQILFGGFDAESNKAGYLKSTYDDGYFLEIGAANGGVDLTGSDGVTAMVARGTNFTVASEFTTTGLALTNMEGAAVIDIGHDGVISASGDLRLGAGAGIDIGGQTNVLSQASLGSTVLASSLTSVGTLSSLTMGGTLNMGSNAITNVHGMTSSLGVKVGGYGLLVNDITRSAGDLNIKLHDAAANHAGFRLANGGFPLKVLSTGVTELNSGNVKIGSSTGAISGSGVLQVAGAAAFNSSITAKGALSADGAITLAGATDTAVVNADDSIYFRDADGTMHRDSIVDFVSNMAGTGLSAASGQLSLSSVGTVTAVGDANATLTEGLSYGSTTLTADRTWTLPASSGLAAGDIIRVKAPANVQTFKIKITGSGAQQIDADNPIAYLESDAAAVALHYVAANKFVIF